MEGEGLKDQEDLRVVGAEDVNGVRQEGNQARTEESHRRSHRANRAKARKTTPDRASATL